jgi:hypothetical protein
MFLCPGHASRHCRSQNSRASLTAMENANSLPTSPQPRTPGLRPVADVARQVAREPCVGRRVAGVFVGVCSRSWQVT